MGRVTRLVCILAIGKNSGSASVRTGCQPATGRLDLIFRACHREIKIKQMRKHLLYFYGAGDEARTRYLHLGKVALYRMSYTRMGHERL